MMATASEAPRRRLLWIVAAALATFASAAPAGAAAAPGTPKLRKIGTVFVSDHLANEGGRYYVWQPGGGPLVVYDTARAQRTTIPVPAACALVWGGAAASRALLNCSPEPGRHQAVIVDLRSGATTAVASDLADVDWTGFGAYWLSGDRCATDISCVRVSVQWRTGERRTEPRDDRILDLDDPSLGTLDGATGPARLFPRREGPYTLLFSPNRGLRLATTGRPQRSLVGCLDTCSAGIRAGLVTWFESQVATVRATWAAGGRTFNWTFEGDTWITSTRHAVIAATRVAQAGGSGAPARYRLMTVARSRLR